MPRSLQTGPDDDVAETAAFVPDVATTTDSAGDSPRAPQATWAPPAQTRCHPTS